ncbi:hypothetical protein QLX67_09990 [Balneolaceae bacterium ANBcel3]|nr:hypothetical protein [Balneolaceae bacterium ANBcel3]
MTYRKGNYSELKIDENSMVAEPSIVSRFLNALYAVVLGAVLVQVFFLYGYARSVVLLYDNIFFLAFLGVCAILGWILGRNFIVWLKSQIENWRLW